MRYKTLKTALAEADGLSTLVKQVYNVVNTYLENTAGVGLLVSQEELRGLAADFVTRAVEVVAEADPFQAVQHAARKYQRASYGGIRPRQFALALVNAVYDYIVSTDANWNDDTIDSEVDAVIEDLGIDPAEVNELVDSIY